jgi:hypothetical protein
MRFFVEPTFNETPPWPAPVFRSHGRIFYICVGRQNTAVVDLDAGDAVAFVSPLMAQDASVLRRIFLDCIVLTLLTYGTYGSYTYVHASAVARDGMGLLFNGPSGSGKSTLAYACARRGFHLVSDDVVYLRPDQNKLTVWGRPWRMRFLRNSLTLFPELAEVWQDSAAVGDEEMEVDIGSIPAVQTQTQCRPVALFFLDRSSNGPSYAPLTETDALILLSRDLQHDIPEAIERHRLNWLHLVRGGAYRLRSGTDLDALVDLLEDFLDARHAK